MIDILLNSLFINYLGITMLLAVSRKRIPFRQAVFAGAAVTVAAAFASLLGFYSSDLYPRPLRFFILPATALFASLVAVRIMSLKKEAARDVVYYNTAVCGTLVLYGTRINSVVSALTIGAASGAGFLLALMSVYVLKYMYAGKREYLNLDVTAEVLFFIGLVSLLISGIR